MRRPFDGPRLIRIVEWITFGAVALLYLRLNSGTWLISADSTDYVEGARSLADLRGYVDATGAPITFFPPGTSAVYALAAMIPETSYWFFNLLTKLLVLVFVGFSALVIRRSAGRGVALMAMLFLALSKTLLSESTNILSDIPFSAMFMVTVWWFPQDGLERLRPGTAVILGCLISCCYLLRTAGLFVCLGYAAYITCCVNRDRMRTLAIVAAVFLVTALPLGLRAIHFANGPSYFRVMATREPWVVDSGLAGPLELFRRASINLPIALRDVAAIFSNQDEPGFSGTLICLLMFLGLVGALVGRRSVLHMFFLLSYAPALLLMEPTRRYLLPVLPLLTLLVVDGARLTWAWVSVERVRRGIQLGILALFCINPYWQQGYGSARNLRAQLDLAGGAPVVHPGHEAFLDLVRTHSHALSRADVIATNHPNILRYFVPGEVTVKTLPLIVNVEGAYRTLRNAGATYLYCDKVDDSIWAHVEPVIKAHASSFELVAEAPGAAIYKMLP